MIHKLFGGRIVYILYTLQNSYSIILVSIFVMIVIFNLILNLFPNTRPQSSIAPQKFSGIVIFHPKISEEQTKLIIFSKELNSNIEIQAYNKLEIELGDNLDINCQLNWDENNYYKFLGVSYSVKNCKNINLIEKSPSLIIKLFAQTRAWIINKSDKLFVRSTSSLVKGLLIGDSSDIPENIKQDYVNAGITHIVAVSGFNMSVVAGFVKFILKAIRTKIRFVLVTIALFFYLAIVGFDNIPALKAFFLILMLNFAKIVGRRPNSVYATLLSSLIVVIIFPGSYTSISFQLSSLAGLAIAIFPQKFSFIMINLLILPVMILGFGTVNPLAVISNIIILPIVEPLTFLSISALINPIAELEIITKVVDWFVQLIQSTANYIASIPFSSVTLGQENTSLVFCIIMILVLIVFEFNFRKHTA